MGVEHDRLGDNAGDSSTPIDEDQTEALVPKQIRTRAELNAWEATNIARANEWAFGRARLDILSVEVLQELHRRMFDAVWTWAGAFRQNDNNISPYHWTQVPVMMRDLTQDTKTRYAASDKSPRVLDDIAIHFHHRLVQIHPWPNGNGRHARLATELLLREWNLPAFTWGAATVAKTAVRDQYLDALRAADKGDFDALREFVRS